jgi:F-type H+-transporting ATPase subunit b
MTVIPDPILVLMQMAPFLVLMFGLNAILFKPMKAYLERRREATAGARDEAIALQEKADLKVTHWEAALARAHAEVAEFRAARRQEASAAHAARLAAARKAADERIADALAIVQGEAALARQQVGPMARALSGEIADRALGRSLSAAEA